MRIHHLVIQEIRQRRVNFILGLLAVLSAAACLAGAATLLRAHELRTRSILAAKEADLNAAMARLEDDYRKITKSLGFNILILPGDQDMSEFHQEGAPTRTMPEATVNKLVAGKITTLQHLLPCLQEKLRWPERNRTIILAGVRGEVPLGSVAKDPMNPPVPPGGIVLGYELHHALNLKPGERLRLCGREFTIAELHPERGDRDDITAWIGLAEAQSILGKPGLINGILALECGCGIGAAPEVRKEVQAILPGVKLLEKSDKALARAQARLRAGEESRQALQREKAASDRLQRERQALAAVLVPLVVVGAALWVGLLAWLNVRERREEIGILRAVGLRSRQILQLFLARAALVGACGGAAGYLVGWVVGLGLGGALGASGATPLRELFNPVLFALVAALAPAVSAAAGWLPALAAARQDPSVILRGE